MLHLENVSYSYGPTCVLNRIGARFSTAQLVALVGPNGAGKSTLLSICAGLRAGFSGQCLIDGKELRQWPRREFSRWVAVVPQNLAIEFPFTAEQVVLMGRSPHCDTLFETAADYQAAEEAMRLTDCLGFRHRDVRSLSGGERQRVILAAAIAQQPRILLLDEPATFLDLKHQLLIYRLMKQICAQGTLVITVTHDLNLAAAFADRVLVLSQGRLIKDAAATEALAPGIIQQVFEVDPRELWFATRPPAPPPC